jgi:hypothetical protein
LPVWHTGGSHRPPISESANADGMSENDADDAGDTQSPGMSKNDADDAGDTQSPGMSKNDADDAGDTQSPAVSAETGPIGRAP